MQALERSVGTELLVRGRGAVRPTPAGTALRPHAVALLRATRSARPTPCRAPTATCAATSRIAAGEALATHVLPPAVSRLRERLPGLVATFVVGDEVRVLEALRGGEVDAALMTDRTDASDLDRPCLRAGPPGAGRRRRRTS